MSIETDGEFPEIEYRMAVSRRVEEAKACLPASYLIPARLLGWGVLLSYRIERLYLRLRGDV